jgi:endoglycosylceramidase
MLLWVWAAPARALPPLSHHGRWFTDSQGRVVILHGIDWWQVPTQLSSPLAFAAPPPAQSGFGPSDAQFLASNGFNLVRLSMDYWEYAPGQFDDQYLDSFLTAIGQLDSAGIYSMPVLMQGLYSPYFYQGEGFPPWMVYTDGIPSDRLGWPNDYEGDPALNRAFDNFWANHPSPDGAGLRDHVAGGWQHLAQKFAGAPGLLGYDLFNEPWPGSQWSTCANPAGCPPAAGFDTAVLDPFYRQLVSSIRSADPAHLIVYEPNLLFDYGANTQDGSPDRNAVFGFHDYCLGGVFPGGGESQGCQLGDQMPLQNAISQSQKTGDALLLGEWGGASGPADTARMLALADQYLMPWDFWAAYSVINNPALPPSGGNINAAELQLLERPYPQTIAGTPTSISFDPNSKEFSTSLTTTLPNGSPAGALTSDIFIPTVQYPNGYHVTVTGASIVPDSDPQHLILQACPEAQTISVNVSPQAGASTTSC